MTECEVCGGAFPCQCMDLCGCGCMRADHDDSGRCMYYFEDDCGGFTYDEESTLLALSCPVDVP
jgi:hypothetical protein